MAYLAVGIAAANVIKASPEKGQSQCENLGPGLWGGGHQYLLSSLIFKGEGER